MANSPLAHILNRPEFSSTPRSVLSGVYQGRIDLLRPLFQPASHRVVQFKYRCRRSAARSLCDDEFAAFQLYDHAICVPQASTNEVDAFALWIDV